MSLWMIDNCVCKLATHTYTHTHTHIHIGGIAGSTDGPDNDDEAAPHQPRLRQRPRPPRYPRHVYTYVYSYIYVTCLNDSIRHVTYTYTHL